MTERDLKAIAHGPSVLPDEALGRLTDSDLCQLLCRLEQWHAVAQGEWDWRQHNRQQRAASAARRIA